MLRLLAKSGAVAGGIGYAGWSAMPLITGDPHANCKAHFDLCTALMPATKLLGGESAHRLGVFAAKHGLLPTDSRQDPPSLHVRALNRDFKNPLGVAAGFDKDGEAIAGLLRLGFGYVEVGTVTPEPQEGNPSPRVFRLPEVRAVINRYGFNNEGMDAMYWRLDGREMELREHASTARGVLGINLGKNKETEDAAEDYRKLIHRLAKFSDYLVINISSPNTPGLRALQGKGELDGLVQTVIKARDELPWGNTYGPPALLVKIAPDLATADLKDIAAVALKHGIDGLIISNTTVERPEGVRGLPHAEEGGGLSGEPLMDKSTEVLAEMYQLTRGKVTLVGVGGVSSGQDAFDKISAGASLVQLYTAMSYQGPSVVPRVKAELAAILEEEGFASVGEAVGCAFRSKRRK